VLTALSQTRFDRARAALAVTGFPAAEVWSQLAQQACTEASVMRGGDPAAAAAPSARAFAAILAHTARLAGNDANIAALAQAGHNLGELVYTLDAYQDLDDDLRRERFNFLAAQTRAGLAGIKEQVRERARQIAARCQQELRQAWAEVELRRYRPVLEAVLLTGLSAKTARMLAASGDDPADERKRSAADTPCWKQCDYRCCDCCYCPSEGDYRCCGECGRHGCYCDDAGCRCGDCAGDGASGGECTIGGCGHGDCSGSDHCACANCGGDGSSCDCSSCDCGNCDCGGGDCNCNN
jgi:hypothetical protein